MVQTSGYVPILSKGDFHSVHGKKKHGNTGFLDAPVVVSWFVSRMK
jgi:hypothetical protein